MVAVSFAKAVAVAAALVMTGSSNTAAADFDPVAIVKARNLADGNPDDTKNNRYNPYSSKFKPLRVGQCPKPMEETADDQDRYCENTGDLTRSSCGCKETCHIWGDPHVSPFFSGCSVVSMKKPGIYTLYELPVNATDPHRYPIRVEGQVSPRGRWEFVTKLFITYDDALVAEKFQTDTNLDNLMFNGQEPVMKANDCDDDPNAGFEVTFPLYNSEGDASADDVFLMVRATCNFKHKNHLNVTIQFQDGMLASDQDNINNLLDLAQTEQIIKERSATVVPDSTIRFPDDIGVCVDPQRYGVKGLINANSLANYGSVPFWVTEECRRPSGFEDGRACTCSAECAAFGDPHVNAFNEVQVKSNAFMAPVKEPEQRVMYSLGNRIAVIVKVNVCQFITGVSVVYAKDTPVDDQIASADNYMVAEYDASELCTEDDDVLPTTRKYINAPRKVIKDLGGNDAIDMLAYDDKVNGFNTGTFIQFSDASVQAVPRAQEEDIESFIAARAASDAATPASVIVTGGIQVVMKCHATGLRKRTGFNEPTKYFNVCVKNTNINVDAPPGFDDESRRVLANDVDDPAVGGLRTVEEVLQSDGWCALGEITKKRNGNVKKYRYRNAADIYTFPFNTEAVKANNFQTSQ